MLRSLPATEPSPVDALMRTVIDAVPSLVFVLDATAHILDANKAAVKLLGAKDTLVFRRLCGDVLFCVHAHETAEGCGTTETCKTCQVRQGAAWVSSGGQLHRKLHRMRLSIDDREQDFAFLVSAAPLDHDGRKLALLILEDVTELCDLREIVPICAHCKKIRNDQAFWESVEAYLERSSDLRFSHGICPDCLATFYPDVT